MALAVLALAAVSLYGTVSLVGTALGSGAGGTPHRPSWRVVGRIVRPFGFDLRHPLGVRELSRPSVAEASSPGPTPSPSPTAKPGPFKIDLYRAGAFVSELTPIWCLSAAMQTSANIMDLGVGKKADRTRARQQTLFKLSRSIAPAPDKAAEPEGWAAA